MVDKKYIFQIRLGGSTFDECIEYVPGWNDTRSNPAANCSFYQPRLRRKSCELSYFSCFFFISQILQCSLMATFAWNHTVAWIVCKNDSELGHYMCHVPFLWPLFVTHWLFCKTGEFGFFFSFFLLNCGVSMLCSFDIVLSCIHWPFVYSFVQFFRSTLFW